jgi:hypothetical protein
MNPVSLYAHGVGVSALTVGWIFLNGEVFAIGFASLGIATVVEYHSRVTSS